MKADSWKRILLILIGLIMAWSFNKYTLPTFIKCHNECKALKAKGWEYYIVFNECFDKEVE